MLTSTTFLVFLQLLHAVSELNCFAFGAEILFTMKFFSKKKNASISADKCHSWHGRATQSSDHLTHFIFFRPKIMGLFGGDSLPPTLLWFQKSIVLQHNLPVVDRHCLRVGSTKNGCFQGLMLFPLAHINMFWVRTVHFCTRDSFVAVSVS